MRFRIITASIMILVFVSFTVYDGRGQTIFSEDKASSKHTSKKRFTIYYHLGSVELPEGYKGYVTTSWTDAWFGYIESPESGLKIYWSGGLVESLFEKYNDNLVKTETETFSNFSIKFGLLRNKKEETLVARIGELQFSAKIKGENDKIVFTEIIRSYQKERCEICRSFRYKSEEKNSEK